MGQNIFLRGLRELKICVWVILGVYVGDVGGGSKKLALSSLVLREFWRQYFAYFFHLDYVRVEKLQIKVI